MARATKEQSELTAKRIRETAREMFADRGYADVQLEDVAKRAGYTRGALYHHFRNKRDLFAAVLRDVQASVADEVLNAAETVNDPWEQLEAGSVAFVQASLQPGVRQVMLIDAPAVLGWEQWRSSDQHHSARLLLDVLQELEANGQITRGTAIPATQLLSGAMNEAALWIATTADPEAATRQATEVLLTMLRSLRV